MNKKTLRLLGLFLVVAGGLMLGGSFLLAIQGYSVDVTFHVLNTEGNPVANAKVFVYVGDTYPEYSDALVPDAVTDLNGEVSGTLGTTIIYTVCVYAEGYTSVVSGDGYSFVADGEFSVYTPTEIDVPIVLIAGQVIDDSPVDDDIVDIYDGYDDIIDDVIPGWDTDDGSFWMPSYQLMVQIPSVALIGSGLALYYVGGKKH